MASVKIELMDKTQAPASASATTPQAPAPTQPEPDLTGQTLGDFRLERRLGQGGMGQVYLAEQISLSRKVAIKLLKADLSSNATSLQRFKLEATNLAKATHANIVQIYAIDKAGDLNYMALEYVEGRNLREHLEKKGSPEILSALSIIRQVASALQRASELGIIHRDIKPENILITKKGEVKVADFGLSRLDENTQPLHLTQTGVAMGTPLYMSPEQVEGKPVDPRSDIYSFGCTCYHLFAGHPPFRGQQPFEVAVQHVQKEPEPLSQIRPDLHPEVCAMVHKMMAKKPEDRYQTGREIVREATRLRDFLVGVTAGSPSVAMGPSPSEPFDAVQTVPLLTKRSLFMPIAVSSVALALLGGLLLGWLRSNDKETTEEPIPAKIIVSAKDREKELLQRWNEWKSESSWSFSGPEHASRLGIFYLKERRLDDAEKFFKELEKTANEVSRAKQLGFKTLGRLGRAMTNAFRDRPDESNAEFLKVLPIADAKIFTKMGWMNPQVCEMIAEALNHNYLNAPATFPKELEKWRYPPEPNTKK